VALVLGVLFTPGTHPKGNLR